jgi:hypothetical protein
VLLLLLLLLLAALTEMSGLAWKENIPWSSSSRTSSLLGQLTWSSNRQQVLSS